MVEMAQDLEKWTPYRGQWLLSSALCLYIALGLSGG